MESKNKTIWTIFLGYLLIIFFVLLSNVAFGQMSIIYFNAGWNGANGVDWINKLNDCKTISYYDISTDKEIQKKYKIAVIPTVILFKDDEEVKRFQADLSFKLVATRKDVQEEIDNQLMSDF